MKFFKKYNYCYYENSWVGKPNNMVCQNVSIFYILVGSAM